MGPVGANVGTCKPVDADGHVDKHILGEPTADIAGGCVSCTLDSGAHPACLPGTAGFLLSMRLDPHRLQLGISGVPTSGTVFWGGSTSESLMGISCAVCALPAPLLAWTAGILQSMRISPHLTGAKFWVDLDVGSFVGNSCAVCALSATWLFVNFCPSTSSASFRELICDLQEGLSCV